MEGSPPPAADWPETGTYAFQDRPKNNAAPPSNETLFLSDPDAVYLWRSFNRNPYPDVCGGFTALNDAIRSHLLTTILADATPSLPEKTVELSIEFHDREDYRARVVAEVEQQQRTFAAVTATLARRDFITEERRQAAQLAIKLDLHDARHKPTSDLPTITFRPPVEWVRQTSP